jgi:hypothetical protein
MRELPHYSKLGTVIPKSVMHDFKAVCITEDRLLT